MLITVHEVSAHLTETIVAFHCEHGDAVGIWCAPSPKIGDSFYVEFNIGHPVSWGDDVSSTKERKYRIGMDDDGVYLVGLIESVEDDGCMSFRFGTTLMLIEADKGSFPVGDFVRLRAKTIFIYPYDVPYC